jgi:hypothetical protein
MSQAGILSDNASAIGDVTQFTVQSGTSPVTPLAGNVNFNGSTVAAGTNPVRTDGTGAHTMALEVQISQAIAATDATKIGLSNFDSARFTVDANGFVSASGTGLGQTITGDTGGALSPTAGNWNIFGGPGVTTTGSGSTLTINSVTFSDVAGAGVNATDAGTFATAALTRTMPVAPSQGEEVIYVCTTAGALVIQTQAATFIRIGSLITSAGGTATSTSIGDAVALRYRTADTCWYAVSSIGTWVMA